MAVTKIWSITSRLDTAIDYIENEEKTDDHSFVTCINCSNDDPSLAMMNTKKMWHDGHKRLAYHAIQSFAPGEGTPEMIHEIGVKLANEIFGNEYQIVVTTHLDKNYLHNHFIINSTSLIDGKHYCNTKQDYRKFKQVSDRLCKEYGLSTIEKANGKGKSRSKYHYQKSYIREIKNDIDRIIPKSFTMTDFKNQMFMEGYEISGEYIIHPFLDEPIDIILLGEKYSIDSIKERILEREYPEKIQYYKVYKPEDLFNKYNNGNLIGLQRLYVKWQIALGILPKYRPKKKYLSKEIKRELKHLDMISHETELLVEHSITNLTELDNIRDSLNDRLNDLIYKRKGAYYQRRLHPDSNEYWSNLIDQYTKEIKEKRYDIKCLNNIDIRSTRLERQLEQLQNREEYRESVR